MEIISGITNIEGGLTFAQIQHVKELYKDREEEFIETITMPINLGLVYCCLHGPLVGELPVREDEVVYKELSKSAGGMSRLCTRPPTDSAMITVLAGKDGKGRCICSKLYGGPKRPPEPFEPCVQGDPRLEDESRVFWAQHALSV